MAEGTTLHNEILISLIRLAFSVLSLLLVACQSTKPSVRGVLLYEGKPADGIFSIEPSFSIGSEESKDVPKPKVVYDKGAFTVWGLPEGKFGMNVNISETGKTPCCFPGDYNAWMVFSVADNMTSYLDVDLRRIIHLTSPQDNSSVMPLWDAQCKDRVVFSGPVQFSWEAIGRDVYYDYLIIRVICPFKQVEVAAQGSTEETGFEVSLPPSPDNEFYLFRLDARRQGRRAGMLMTHGKNGGYGWDLRFRVR